MDFEFAIWQMLYLFYKPQNVYRNFQYRKVSDYEKIGQLCRVLNGFIERKQKLNLQEMTPRS